MPLDRLVAGIVALWCAAVVFTVVLAVAFPLQAGGKLPGGVQVLDLVGSLANFCPACSCSSRSPPARTRAGIAATRGGAPPAAGGGRRRRAVPRRHATPVPEQPRRHAAQGPLFGIASGLILATFVYGGWTRRMARVLAPIGLVSYGVYLWHWVILSTLVHNHVQILGGQGNVAAVAASPCCSR